MRGETDPEVLFRNVISLFQGSDYVAFLGLFDSDVNIIRSFFTCKFLAGYFAKNTVFSVVVLLLALSISQIKFKRDFIIEV